tara:strand:- start:538 stop:1158 length:621 start_codon:yes stop_codon:yes gene_type:complete
MPIEKINKTKNYTCVFWKIEENLDTLLEKLKANSTELKQLDQITNLNRKKQNITARLILNYLSKKKTNLLYTKNGKPYCNNFNHISISHSKKYCILLKSEKPAGVDIQHKHKNIEKLIPKFIHKEEEKKIDKKNIIPNLHFIWCAKEAIYKTLNTSCSLKENIFVNKIKNTRNTNAYYNISKKSTKYKVIFEQINDYYIAIAMKDE